MEALMPLKGATYKTEELTVRPGESFALPEGAIVVSAKHTFDGSHQLLVLVPDGPAMLHEAAKARQRGK